MEEEKAKEVCAKLLSLGIDFTSVSHEPIMTMEEGVAIAEKLDVIATKNLFLVNRQGEHFLLLLRGDKKFRTKDLARQIGSSHLSFASAEELKDILHIEQGAVSILSLMFDKDKRVRLLVDKDVLRQEYIGCHPCVNTCSLRLRTKDITEKFLPVVGHTIEEIEI